MPLLEDILNQAKWGGQQFKEDVGGLFKGDFSGGGRLVELISELLPGGKAVGQGVKKMRGAISDSPLMKSVIDPKTWELMQPEARDMMLNIKAKFPEFFSKVMKSPIKLLPQIQNLDPGLWGQMAVHRPSRRMAELAGKPGAALKPQRAVMDVIGHEAGKERTPVHELQHMLNFERVQKTDPADAATIGGLLSEILQGQDIGSLYNRIDQRRKIAPQGITGKIKELVHRRDIQDPWSKKLLYDPDPVATDLVSEGEGYYKPGESLIEVLNRTMMDEGLAYLGEATTQQPQEFRNISGYSQETISNLAKKLGVGVK